MKKKVSLMGWQLVHCPELNKGTAFTMEERDTFHLTGLLPCHVSSIEEQVKRRYANFCEKRSNVEKYLFLHDLQNRNTTLFYRLVLDHVQEMLPFIYTPTVGDISLDYSTQYTQTQGLFLTLDMKEELEEVLRRTKRDDVEVIVVTDGGRILGLGDMGVGGMVIPVGKLTLYALFGGVDPSRTLPIFLDVGTDNEMLLQDPLYLGRKTKRQTGEAYYQFVDAFVSAVKKVYPKALIQWEDFSKEHATTLMTTYQQKILSFNDDIQGTAASTLAGILSAVRHKHSSLEDEKICIYGAGSAGLGIAQIIHDYLTYKGLSAESAYRRISLIDRNGLIHDGLGALSPEHKKFAKPAKVGHISLHQAIRDEEITILIGVSAHKGAFDKKSVSLLLKNTTHPIIFPLSNPNSKSEAEPKDLITWSDGKAIIATGSPYAEVTYKKKTIHIPQCNNVYIFPAFGLAAKTRALPYITQKMFLEAAIALSEEGGASLFPPFSHLRDVTKRVAARILQCAATDNLLLTRLPEPLDLVLDRLMWAPAYAKYELHDQAAALL